jgi:hypothetical protein
VTRSVLASRERGEFVWRIDIDRCGGHRHARRFGTVPLDQSSCAFVSGEREQRGEMGPRKNRWNTERAGVFGSGNGFA